jgi:AcrR family transcriptional regulator
VTPKAPDLMKLAVTTRPAQGAIVAAAVQVFVERGYTDTRVEDILQRAGIARRTFYKYFRSKEAVLLAIYELGTSELLKAIRAAASAAGDPLEGVRFGLDVYLDAHVGSGPLMRILIEQAARPDSELAATRRRFREQLVQLLDDAVRAAAGESRDPMLYAALIAALEGISLDLVTAGVKKRDVKRAKAVFHFLLSQVTTKV